MNLNKLARTIALKEGKKKQVNIAQIKEILKIALTEISREPEDTQLKTIAKYEKYQ